MIEATAGLQTSQPSPPRGALAAVRSSSVARTRSMPQGADDLVQLGAGVREAAAQALVDLDAVRLQLGVDELAEHLHATAAAGTGLGALLHLGHGACSSAR